MSTKWNLRIRHLLVGPTFLCVNCRADGILALQDGPPSPLRRMMDSVDDFGPAGTEDLDGMGIDPPPVMPHPTDLGESLTIRSV